MLPPVALSLPRRAARDVGPADASGVPAGAVAFVSPLLEHRAPDVFPQPHRFVPERWKDLRPSPFTFLPFGVGRRRCPGAGFADLQVLTTLSLLFERSGWSLSQTRVGFRTDSGIILMPDRPLPVRRSRGERLERITGPLTALWQPGGQGAAGGGSPDSAGERSPGGAVRAPR